MNRRSLKDWHELFLGQLEHDITYFELMLTNYGLSSKKIACSSLPDPQQKAYLLAHYEVQIILCESIIRRKMEMREQILAHLF